MSGIKIVSAKTEARWKKEYGDENWKEASDRAAASNFGHVRRPHRGIQITGDTYATMELVTAAGRQKWIVDAGSWFDTKVPGFGKVAATQRYSNFILQNVATTRTEKYQVVETFGDHFVFFFGERPIQLNASGVLLKTEDFGWRNEFLANYEKLLRGTKCVENRAKLVLSWDDVLVSGYLTNLTINETAESPHHVIMTFSMLVMDLDIMSGVGNPMFNRFSAPPSELLTPADKRAYRSSTYDVRKESLNHTYAPKNLAEVLSSSAAYKTIASARQSVRDTLRELRHMMTGRTERVPAGYAGSELLAGEPEFAAGSLSTDLVAKLYAGSKLTRRTKRAPAEPWISSEHTRIGRFSDAVDEYPQPGSPQAFRLREGDSEAHLLHEDDVVNRAEKVLKEYGLTTERDSVAFATVKQIAARGVAYVATHGSEAYFKSVQERHLEAGDQMGFGMVGPGSRTASRGGIG